MRCWAEVTLFIQFDSNRLHVSLAFSICFPSLPSPTPHFLSLGVSSGSGRSCIWYRRQYYHRSNRTPRTFQQLGVCSCSYSLHPLQDTHAFQGRQSQCKHFARHPNHLSSSREYSAQQPPGSCSDVIQLLGITLSGMCVLLHICNSTTMKGGVMNNMLYWGCMNVRTLAEL